MSIFLLHSLPAQPFRSTVVWTVGAVFKLPLPRKLVKFCTRELWSAVGEERLWDTVPEKMSTQTVGHVGRLCGM